MKTLASVNVVVFAILILITVYIGLDPKKWRSWLVGLYGFLTFFMVGMVGIGDYYQALKFSSIATGVIMLVGITTYLNRERAKRWLKDHDENKR